MNKNDLLANHILHVLETQRFFDWHADGGDFGDYISSETGCKTKEEILEQIKKWFIPADFNG